MIHLKNGTFIDWRTLEFSHVDLFVEEGKGGRVFQSIDFKENNRIISIDCTGMLITRSFANGHHHVYSALARGMPAPKKIPQNFQEILRYIWWNIDKALDLEMIRASALVTAIQCVKNGVTFVIDHHASPFAVEGSLETIAEAFDEVGVGHLLCYEISDRDGKEIARMGLNETKNYLKSRDGLVGLHASFTVGDETLASAVDLASETRTGIHIHVAEDLSDQMHCQEHYGVPVVERLHRAGALDFPGTILGHCLHLSERERMLVAQSPSWVVQNMESNLNNKVGRFDSEGLGQRIMLGTDGMHSDMIRSAKAAFFAGHDVDRIDYSECYRRFRNVHNYLSGMELDTGENNLVVLDYPSPTPIEQNNFQGHFLFGIESSQVKHVLANGELIVEDGKVVNVDEPEILAFAREKAIGLWRKL